MLSLSQPVEVLLAPKLTWYLLSDSLPSVRGARMAGNSQRANKEQDLGAPPEGLNQVKILGFVKKR